MKSDQAVSIMGINHCPKMSSHPIDRYLLLKSLYLTGGVGHPGTLCRYLRSTFLNLSACRISGEEVSMSRWVIANNVAGFDVSPTFLEITVLKARRFAA